MSIRQNYKAYIATNVAKREKQGGKSDRGDVPHQDMSERDKVIDRLKRRGEQ